MQTSLQNIPNKLPKKHKQKLQQKKGTDSAQKCVKKDNVHVSCAMNDVRIVTSNL